MDVSQALNASFGQDIPIVRDINEALRYQPDTLLIGIAPMGGALPAAWRWQLLKAVEAGFENISGPHGFFFGDEGMRAAAARFGGPILGVRRPPEKKPGAQILPPPPRRPTMLV